MGILISNQKTNSSQDEASSAAAQARTVALLKRIEVGDQSALAEFYDCYSPLVYTFAIRLCRDTACAEEVLHHVFLQVWRTPAAFTAEQQALDTKLGVLAKKLVVEVLLRRKYEQQPGIEGPLFEALPPAAREVSIDHLHF